MCVLSYSFGGQLSVKLYFLPYMFPSRVRERAKDLRSYVCVCVSDSARRIGRWRHCVCAWGGGGGESDWTRVLVILCLSGPQTGQGGKQAPTEPRQRPSWKTMQANANQSKSLVFRSGRKTSQRRTRPHSNVVCMCLCGDS